MLAGYGELRDVLAGYGELEAVPAAMGAHFAAIVQSEEAPKPQLVVVACLALADLPAGQRPTRTEAKEVTSRDYIFLTLFEGRQISLASWSAVATLVYGLILGLEARAPLHFMFSVLSVLFSTVNFKHAGSPGFGEHPRVSRHGRNVEIVFGP